MHTAQGPLNRQTASDYVLAHLTNLGYEDIVIGRITAWKRKDCPPHFDVVFTFRSEESKGGIYEGLFEVWMEDGRIYGEW